MSESEKSNSSARDRQSNQPRCARVTLTGPPSPLIPQKRMSTLAQWGPVLTGIAAVIGALGAVGSGAVKVSSDNSDVIARIELLDSRLDERDKHIRELRELVSKLETKNWHAERKVWELDSLVQSYHPKPKKN